MPNIKFNDLQTYNQQHKSSFVAALKNVLDQGQLILGSQVEQFENEFASYIGTKHGIGVASGTDAIILALQSLGLQPHDEVLIPVNVYPVAFAVATAGYKFKLVDIAPNSYNLDPLGLESHITASTKVIILVHLYGQAANLEPIIKLAQKHHLTLIEDCSQAHGTHYHKRKVGSYGELSIFSLYPTKDLGALGDGGIILTNHTKQAQILRGLRQYGETSRYQSQSIGRVSRLDELQAAFLRIKLQDLDHQIQKRIHKAAIYHQHLQGIPQIALPHASQDQDHSYHLYVIRCQHRQALITYLQAHGIQTGIHYPHLINQVPAFKHLTDTNQTFTNAQAINPHILSLPFYPDIKIKDIKYISQTIKDFYLKHP